MSADRWKEVSREIIDRINIAEEARALGVRFTSDVKSNGWMDCHAIDREDSRPSAGIFVGDGKMRGYYRDFGGDGMRFFDWSAKLLSLPDWKAARKHYADKLGIKMPNSRPPETLEDKLAWEDWNDLIVRIWCEKKGGITVEAVKMAGGRLASYPKKNPPDQRQCVIAFPTYGKDLTADDPCGWVMVNQEGGDMKVFRKGQPPSFTKTQLAHGSQGGGLMNPFALDRITDAEVIWKVEGVSDMLALQSIIPDELRNKHVVITNACGTNETVQAWWLRLLRGKKVYVVHDADIPGQAGAEKWTNALVGVASEVRNVQLPYPIEPCHGKDLRDLLMEGHSYADLLVLTDATPLATAATAERGQDNRCESCRF